jgi:hypothetical protein
LRIQESKLRRHQCIECIVIIESVALLTPETYLRDASYA